MHSPLNCAINKKHFIWALNKARERERGEKRERQSAELAPFSLENIRFPRADPMRTSSSSFKLMKFQEIGCQFAWMNSNLRQALNRTRQVQLLQLTALQVWLNFHSTSQICLFISAHIVCVNYNIHISLQLYWVSRNQCTIYEIYIAFLTYWQPWT